MIQKENHINRQLGIGAVDGVQFLCVSLNYILFVHILVHLLAFLSKSICYNTLVIHELHKSCMLKLQSISYCAAVTYIFLHFRIDFKSCRTILVII